MSAKDAAAPQIGDVYEDKDGNNRGRQVVVVSEFEKRDPWNRVYAAFRVRVIAAPNRPTSIGNVSSVGAENLIKRYRKVTTTTKENN